jgi:septal ring factor EnvC (AmiA/AmiB activator)
MTPTQEQIAEWRDKAKYIWHKEPSFEGDEHPSNCFIQGYIRARTEQAEEIEQTQADIERALYALTESETENDTLKAEIAELKAKLANAKSEVAVLKQGLGVRMKSWQK